MVIGVLPATRRQVGHPDPRTLSSDRPAPCDPKAATSAKLKTRLSKGEKRNRKRLAEVGAVYQAAPAPRTVADVLPHTERERADAVCGPVAATSG